MPRAHRRTIAASTVMAVIIAGTAPASATAGTGSTELTATTYPARFETGASGGTVRIGSVLEAFEFNPYLAHSNSAPGLVMVTEGSLVTITDDLRYRPDLAKSVPTVANGGVEVEPDGTATVTWRLRAGLEWSDGRALTCRDYAYTAKWIIKVPSPEAIKDDYLTASGLAHYRATGTIRAQDINLAVTCPTATRMIWHFKEAAPRYLALLPYPLPKHYLSAIPLAEAANGAGYQADDMPDVPVSGPFRFDAIHPGDRIELSRNPAYRDRLAGGPAYLAHLVFVWYQDNASLIAAYDQPDPEIDVAMDLTQADLPAVSGLDRVVAMPHSVIERLLLNWSPDHCSTLQSSRGGACPLHDRALRMAISYAVDRDGLNADVLGGFGMMSASLLEPDEWYASAATPRDYDPDAARMTLANAGWVLDTDRNVFFRDLDENGSKTGVDYDAVIQACTTKFDPIRRQTLDALTETLAEVGIVLKVRAAIQEKLFGAWDDTDATTRCNLQHGNFDILHVAYYQPPDDPTLFVDRWHSSRFPPTGDNSGHVDRAAVDAALEVATSSMDANAVYDAMGALQALHQSQIMDIPLYYRQGVALVDPYLRNVSPTSLYQGVLWNTQHWWIDD